MTDTRDMDPSIIRLPRQIQNQIQNRLQNRLQNQLQNQLQIQIIENEGKTLLPRDLRGIEGHGSFLSPSHPTPGTQTGTLQVKKIYMNNKLITPAT